MVPSGLHLINPFQLAEKQERLTGTIRVSALKRIKDVLHDDAGSVKYEFHFGKDEQGVVFVQGEFSVDLKVKCQRCMGPMNLPISGKIQLGAVNSSMTQEFPERYEPLILAGNEISLEALLEEEILLALPIAPAHDRDDCIGSRTVDEYKPEHGNPFSVLKDLKIDK